MSKVLEQLGDWAPLYQRVVDDMGDSYKLLTSTLKAERASRTVYPSSPEVLRAFEMTQLKDVKVVIIGQDPYHNGAATGLAFSVRNGYTINPSLRVIYKELCLEHGEDELPDFDFSLEHWAKQGVLLLNTTLTVVKGHPNSHESLWKGFVDGMVKELVREKDNVVFLLWGKYAQNRFKALIEGTNMYDGKSHVVITSPHPAAEVYGSMKAGYIGSNCFMKANDNLAYPIDWVNSSYEVEHPLPQDSWDGGQIQEP
jgi:uracil-DNA glycosylase